MKKRWVVLLAAALCSTAMAGTAFAAGWQRTADGRYWYAKDNGAVTSAASNWRMDSTGQWYWGTDRNAGDNSYCSNGWWWIYDGASQMMKCYYFDAQGYMLANTTAPDGNQVNENGEWVKDGAVVSIFAPTPNTALRADFDYTQYLPGNYEANAVVRAAQAGWQKDANGWWYKNSSDGTYLQNGWWWIYDSGIQGMKCYYFNSQGYMLAGTVAPDGGQLNANGEWVKNGVVQVIAAPEAEAAISYQEEESDSEELHLVSKKVRRNNDSSAENEEEVEEEQQEEETEDEQQDAQPEKKPVENETAVEEQQPEKEEQEAEQETAGTEQETQAGEHPSEDETSAEEQETTNESEAEESEQEKNGWSASGEMYYENDNALNNGWWWIDADPKDGSTDGMASLYYFAGASIGKNKSTYEGIDSDETGKATVGYKGKPGAEMPIETGGTKRWQQEDTEKEVDPEEQKREQAKKDFNDFTSWVEWQAETYGMSLTLIGGNANATADVQAIDGSDGSPEAIEVLIRIKRDDSYIHYDALLEDIRKFAKNVSSEYISRGLSEEFDFTVEARKLGGELHTKYVNGVPMY